MITWKPISCSLSGSKFNDSIWNKKAVGTSVSCFSSISSLRKSPPLDADRNSRKVSTRETGRLKYCATKTTDDQRCTDYITRPKSSVSHKNSVNKQLKQEKMKLSSFLLASIASVESAKVKTLLNRPEEDRKVPHRHPLQRLWRLYQFSEEIIQTHFYESDMPEGKLDRLRGRIGKWLYLAQRQSFLRSK